MRYTIILLVLGLALLAVTLFGIIGEAQVVEEFLFDVVVIYHSDEGWDIVAKDGWQIGPNIKVVVYTNQPGIVHITAVAGDEKIFDSEDPIEFKKEYAINVPSSKYGQALTITVVCTWGRISKTIIKSYTVVKAPIAPKKGLLQMFTPEQIQKLISSIKWDTILKALIASLAGIGAAAFLKYKAMMLEPINALQIPLLAAAATISFTLEPEAGAGYFMIWLLSDFLSYKFMKGPALIGILELKNAEREVWDIMLPIYTTEDGRLAIALQRSDWAIRRLMGKHVYLELKGDVEALWKKNGSYDLIIAEKTQLKQKTITEKLPSEETEGLELEKEKRKAWVFEVEVADAHTLDFVIDARTFSKLKKRLMELEEENRELISQLDHAIERAKTEALIEWAKARGTLDFFKGGEE